MTGSRAAVPATSGDAPHLTLQDLHDDLVEIRSRLPAAHESAELEELSKTLKRRQKIVVPLMWVVGIVGTVFSAGMAWAVFIGENATETEVEAELKAALEEHNQGPVADGPHSQMSGTLQKHTKEIGELTRILTDQPYIAGYTYTQLTDVEQEVNGIYSFDRKLKLDGDRLKAIFAAPAAIEAR